MNRLSLRARVIEVKPLRYTPAGIPVQELLLEHCGESLEAGYTRKVEFTVPAVAIGEMATQVQQVALGTEVTIQGFLSASRKNSSKLVLHIQTVQFARQVPSGVLV